ncbi:hypothetical protein [Photobacterium lutimaris]|uniref:Uncharacterized protein n=1 Tax=Photobacterium lutimaris TaxID=388278 RepID=A0A2T3J0Z6_9GAMM|nr:hypothetical protein [Photobacterium lutimaris]PSU34751.1 hypothetical protein C9I99_06555 [Photobacterium lutimaris]TDR77074.1 hypothetical protein DFP78_10281 [Photobacterium lutimaris]
MRLQKMVANVVIFIMLFVSVALSASVSPYSSINNDDCNTPIAISHCCSPVSTNVIVSDTGSSCSLIKATPTDNCCKDNQCHSGQIPVAILAEELVVVPLVGSYRFKEIEGSHRLIQRIIFRPPVIA